MPNLKLSLISLVLIVLLSGCAPSSNRFSQGSPTPEVENDPFWSNATVYFMLTDRFHNGETTNDLTLERGTNGAVLRNFMGGDIAGVTQKIREGYFNNLGVDVIWMTPVYEQIHGYWEDDWGDSYPFHGYWPLDWTAVDPNFGTEAQMQEMIDAAHDKGIRVLADVILNHTGPATKKDPAWPSDWIRTRPLCNWSIHNFENTVECALAPSLTDIKTESDVPVALPKFLLAKWKREGRLDQELAELDEFFSRTKLPRAPKNYIIKWITDWVRDHGIDGFRVDTAKHVEPELWRIVKQEGVTALEQWRDKNPTKALGNKPFFMLGEVYEFGLDGFKYTPKGTRKYDYGDRQVDFFDHGFDALINMGFASHARRPIQDLYALYSRELNSDMFAGKTVLNYLVSHDDPEPYDKDRKDPYEAAIKLLLAPGAAQIYYGDELARPLFAEGAIGDAHWRVPMNWVDLENQETKNLLLHWQKLGQFRKAYPAVGAGKHTQLQAEPFIFSRKLKQRGFTSEVLVALGLPNGEKSIPLFDRFADGTKVKDHYSGNVMTVTNGAITLDTPFGITLLAPL